MKAREAASRQHPHFSFDFTTTTDDKRHRAVHTALALTMSRVKAVRVSCSGEAHKRDKIKEFCQYNILDTHNIFTKGELSQLANLIGVQVLVIKMRPSMMCSRRNTTLSLGRGLHMATTTRTLNGSFQIQWQQSSWQAMPTVERIGPTRSAVC